MATLVANYSFDQNNLNLNRLYDGAFDFGLADNVYYTPFEGGDTFKDVYFVNWSEGLDDYQSSFGGPKITVNNNDIVNGGTVTGFLESYLVGDTIYPIWGVSGMSVSATAIYKAATTNRTSDDYKIVNKALSGNDKFFLSDEDDFAKGLGGRDKMYGYGGDDNLSGGSGNDKLYGGLDSDKLKGGDGNDKLFGEEGNDILKGQGGADRFVFRAGYEQDTVKDFSDKDDVLDLRSFDFDSVKEAKSYASDVDGDTVFDFGGGDLLILEDFNRSDLDKGDFII